MTKPSCLIADEPISALDASAQAQIANLLSELVDDADLGLILVSHDLSVVRQVADRVAVMYLGRIVEIGATDVVWGNPRHPYTEALVAAIPARSGPAYCRPTCPATYPTRPIPRRAAGSTRAARSPRTAAANSTSGWPRSRAARSPATSDREARPDLVRQRPRDRRADRRAAARPGGRDRA